MGYPRAPMPDADMPFNVTMFTGDDQRIDHVIAKGMNQLVMRAAFQKACALPQTGSSAFGLASG